MSPAVGAGAARRWWRRWWRAENGAGSVYVVVMVAVLIAAAMAVGMLAGVLRARQAATAAADLAALAAAGSGSADACVVADRVARANAAEMLFCAEVGAVIGASRGSVAALRGHGVEYEVVTEVSLPGSLRRLGSVTGSARAGTAPVAASQDR